MLGGMTPTGWLSTTKLDCSAEMLLRIRIVQLHVAALTAMAESVRRFYQGWYIWRQNWGRRKQLNDETNGGPDRLDRSGHPMGGPILLVRPNFAVALKFGDGITA